MKWKTGDTMHVKILGPMTKQAEVLLQNTAVALKKLKMKATFEKVSEFRKVAAYGAIALPALVIDDRLISVGSVLNVEEAMALLRQLQ
jgi:Ni,Fe-hydrogenase III small subunit